MPHTLDFLWIYTLLLKVRYCLLSFIHWYISIFKGRMRFISIILVNMESTLVCWAALWVINDPGDKHLTLQDMYNNLPPDSLVVNLVYNYLGNLPGIEFF